MTGFQIASQAAPTTIGEANRYYWFSRRITLRAAVYHGSGPFAAIKAVHEVAHHRQNIEMPWLKYCRWFVPVRIWCECDAWLRAVEALA